MGRKQQVLYAAENVPTRAEIISALEEAKWRQTSYVHNFEIWGKGKKRVAIPISEEFADSHRRLEEAAIESGLWVYEVKLIRH